MIHVLSEPEPTVRRAKNEGALIVLSVYDTFTQYPMK